MKSSAPPRVALGGLRDTRPTRLGSSPAADDAARFAKRPSFSLFCFSEIPPVPRVESREVAVERVLESFLESFFPFSL